jgi:peroxiredoxin
MKKISSVICLVIFLIFANQAWAENKINSDSDYDITIAVTINGNDYIMGRLDYSNYGLQLVTFIPIGSVIYTEPYVFEILEKKIFSKNVHRIKCRCINDKYAGNSVAIGTIDFSNESKPKIHLVNEGGYTYISNMSEKGKKTAEKYIPNVWLGN